MAGDTTTYFRTSSGQSGTPAARRPITAARVRCRSSTLSSSRRRPERSSSPRSMRAAPANTDFNGAHQDGVGFYQVTQSDGRRWSAADAYLHPAQERANLTVQTDALATSVVIEGGRAVGVRYLHRGAEHIARADGRGHLVRRRDQQPAVADAVRRRAGRPPARARHHGRQADSPGVGANLSDHPIVTAIWSTPRVKRPGRAGRPEEPAALAADPFRPVHDQYRPVGRVRQDRAWASRRPTCSGTRCRCRSATAAWPTRPTAGSPCW